VRRSRVFRTSSFRLALVYAAMTGLSFIVLFGVILWSTAHFMRHQIDDSVANEIDEIVSDPQSINLAGLASVVSGLARHSGGFQYLLQDSGGIVVAGNMPGLEPQPGIRELTMASGTGRRRDRAIRGKGVAVEGGYLFVGWSTHQLREMEEMVAGSFIWGLTASVALALVGGVFAGHRIMRKIEAVSETTRDIVAGDLTRRVRVSAAGDEFDNLAASVNRMLDRIEALMGELQQVTTDIAHDLRTPLSRLRQRLERAQRPEADAAELRDAIAGTVGEIDVILGIFGALLRIAQIESGARRAGFAAVDLNELLGTVAELYRSSAEERGQVFRLAVADNLRVRGDRELLLQLFANLVENAITHSPPQATIVLSASIEAGRTRIVIADNGPGIPAQLRTKVLQRFVRLESSRTTQGSGLGLSLVHAIVKLHEASLELSDNEPGLRVTVVMLQAELGVAGQTSTG
jgi:signal transduction histidine kinase